MTVQELIQELQKLPPELPVVIHDGEWEDYWDDVAVARYAWGDVYDTAYIYPIAVMPLGLIQLGGEEEKT